jgi:hypothetical protein
MANPAGESNDGVLKLDFDRRFVLRRLQRWQSNRGCQMKFSKVICNVRSGDMR